MLTNWGDLLTNVPASGTAIAPATVANTITVANQAARLALVYGTGTGQVQELDQVLQTSDSTLWVLLASDPSVSGNWSRLPGNDASALTTGTLPAARYTSSPTTNNLLRYNGTVLADSGLSDDGSTLTTARQWDNSYSIGHFRLNGSIGARMLWGAHFVNVSDCVYASAPFAINKGTAASKALEVVDSAAAQLRLTHTAAAYFADHTVNSSGDYAIRPVGECLAIGNACYAPGSRATAIGASATVSSDCPQSVAIGYGATIASGGSYSHTLGGSCSANMGISLGYASSASGGTGATALGGYTNASGERCLALGFGAVATSFSVAMGASAVAALSYSAVLGSPNYPIYTIWAGKGAPHATPTAWGIQGTSGLGTDIAGGACHLRGGQPTGSGAGGSAILQTAAPGSTGTTLRSLVDRLEADTHGVIWIHPVTTAPTVGRTDMIGLFSDAGVLKFIKEDNSVVTVTAS